MTTTTATITAKADAGVRGQQFVARISGADKSGAMTRQFLGTSKGVSTTEVQATPGLYQARTVTQSTKVRSGGQAEIADAYYLVWMDGTDARATEIEESAAMDVAAKIQRGPVDWTEIGKAAQISRHETWLANKAGMSGGAILRASKWVGQLAPGAHSVDEFREAHRAEVLRLRGESPDRPLDLDGGPTDPAFARAKLEAERATLIARLAEIDAALAGY